MNKEVRQLTKRLRKSGWSQQATRSGHIRMVHPSGEFIVMASTPSDRRWLQNIEAEVKALLNRVRIEAIDEPIIIDHEPLIIELPEVFVIPPHRTLLQLFPPFI